MPSELRRKHIKVGLLQTMQIPLSRDSSEKQRHSDLGHNLALCLVQIPASCDELVHAPSGDLEERVFESWCCRASAEDIFVYYAVSG